MSSSNCCFLTCIQVSQEAGQVAWYSHVFQNFPQFIVLHTVKGFGIVNKAEIDVFLELSCFFDDPHAQFRDEARSPCIVLRHGFLKLPSVYAFPPGKSFLLLGTPFLVFWLENHGFSFSDVLCTAHNRVCSWDLVVRDQREKSNRDSSHTLDSMVSLLREKGFLSLSFVLLLLPLCHCRIKLGLGQEREWKTQRISLNLSDP